MSATKVLTVPEQPTRVHPMVNSPTPAYNVSIGCLRAFITLMVVAHHAALAYHPYAPAPPATLTAVPRIWQAFPVVDSQRSTLFALFVGFNDMFFMALMFFLSGLFVWKSLERKRRGRVPARPRGAPGRAVLNLRCGRGPACLLSDVSSKPGNGWCFRILEAVVLARKLAIRTSVVRVGAAGV